MAWPDIKETEMTEDITLAGAFQALAASDNIPVPPPQIDVAATYQDTIKILNGRLEAQEAEINRLNGSINELTVALSKARQAESQVSDLVSALLQVLGPGLKDMVATAVEVAVDERLRNLPEELGLDSIVERAVEDKFDGRDFDEAVKEVVSNLSFNVEVTRY